MIKGKVLRKQECDVVVQHEDFTALSVALVAEDWVTAKALTDPNTGEFGKLITRAALRQPLSFQAALWKHALQPLPRQPFRGADRGEEHHEGG